MTSQSYIGQELDLFAHAVRWKRYWHRQIAGYLTGSVLEVGAGLGVNTVQLRTPPPKQSRWLAIEPDPALHARLVAHVQSAQLPPVETRVATIADLPESPTFDAILYIDVLEHIEADAAEFQRAAARLNPGGRVIILSPAHPWLFTPFDAALGHFRRYTRRTLLAAAGGALPLERMRYLDSVGMLASLGNRLLLRQSHPTLRQILTWDRLMVPCSRVVDPLFLYTTGKSILGIWRKPR